MNKTFGIISYNIYANFTNYGSALQSWALHQAVNKISDGRWTAMLVDYCPDVLARMNPLNPIENMWDTDEQSRKMCEKSLPAIRENYFKFETFYSERFNRSQGKYTSLNINQIVDKENLSGFIIGSDTVFCIDEFGFDDGFYANYDCMKNGYVVSYAASFGDSHFDFDSYEVLNKRLLNFNAIGLRESKMVDYVKSKTTVPVKKVIDPTLLLTSEDYDKIASERKEKNKYLLLYARRSNTKMIEFAEKLANENGWKIIEISLRGENKKNTKMYYEAGVEEFLSLVKYSEYVVTNSYHGMIFSVQYCKPFSVFSREQCDTKIIELLELFGLSDRLMNADRESRSKVIDYTLVHTRIDLARKESFEFLEKELIGCK